MAAKSVPHGLNRALAGYGDNRLALSITQATEAGMIYRTNEIASLAEIARMRSLAVHMDGARFANALLALYATPARHMEY